jgi:hypothetical protein
MDAIPFELLALRGKIIVCYHKFVDFTKAWAFRPSFDANGRYGRSL